MPIRVTCRCGQSLSVPDAMAGKSGKCPKCAEIIRIPGSAAQATSTSGASGPAKGSAQASRTPKPAGAMPKAAAKPIPPAGGGALDQLFSDAGLDKKKGPECPTCLSPIQPGAMICTHCGLNLSTGQKLKGVAIESPKDPSQFANRQLSDAHRSLKKETEADEKAKYTGAPWWVSLAVVLGLVMIIAFGVIMVEGRGGDEAEGVSLRAPANSLRGKIQRLPLPNAMLLVGATVSSMVVAMAWIATCGAAFRDKVGQGILCLIPPYPLYYSLINRKTMGSTMRILWGWSVVLIATMIGMATTGTLNFMLK